MKKHKESLREKRGFNAATTRHTISKEIMKTPRGGTA
jgi:hypothetical protein